MYKRKKIGVFIPTYNESDNIISVLKSMPSYVDKVIIVDDASTDDTVKKIKKVAKKDKRIILLINNKNMGNGYGAKVAYQIFIKENFDLIAPIAGDGQTDPKYLPKLIQPILENKCDLTKGNRFIEKPLYKKMPFYRYLGNIIITILNKFATGYYQMFDCLNGYYVIKADALKKIDFNKLGNRYEFENSLWIQMNINNIRIKDISIPAIYKDEKSKIQLFSTIFKTIYILIKGFFERIFYKYVIINFSPIGLFFIFGFILFSWGVFFGLLIFINFLKPMHIPATSATVMLSVVPFFIGFELILQAIVLDIQNEPK